MEKLPNKLEDNRFVISKESMELMKKERVYFEEKKKEVPELAGITFFGSRTVGKEKENLDNKEEEKSDLDMCVFYDSSSAWEFKDGKFELNQNKIDDIKEKIFNLGYFNSYYTRKLKEYTASFLIDISSHNLEIIINDFRSLFLDSYIEFNKESVPMEAWHVAPIFFLGVGDGLYKARGEIFDILEKLPNGQIIWEKIVDYISEIERDKKTKKRDPLTPYNNYPRTIDKAREYFNSEPIQK